MSMEFTLDEILIDDWSDVCAIYQEGIDSGDATFETEPPSSFDEWMEGKNGYCSIIARESLTREAVGWASLSPTSKRYVFRGVVELSIYITKSAQGYGLGKALMAEIIERSENVNIWLIQSGIFPENIPSLRLHSEELGFRQVGVREKIGLMQCGEHKGEWRDIVMMERRSQVVGVSL